MTARPSLAPPRSQHAPSATATGPPRPPGPATAATLPSRAPSTASTKRPDPIHLTGEASKSTRSRQTASTAGAAKPLASSLRLDVPRRPSEDGPPPKSVTFAAPPKPGPIDAPRGKPQLRFGPTGAASAGASDPSSSALSDAAAPGAPPPMPYRPGSMVPVEARRPSNQIVRGPAGQTPDPVGRPYVMEPSPAAPHLGPKKRADFFPYVGHHPEDKLSDFVIRQGFFDKTQISREELTARNVLLPVLKHRRGLKRLSTFFVSVLEQRQQRHRVTAPSSFKPPPRVTLTDTKRETWLRDLASPAVPLRRLSRTIPHGVRGKGLLEQCLGKYVPVERAVWLAKCVGANEMRAFRRKGAGGTFAVGGEVKWVRDWTINVEQFLESMVDACGQKDWKAQMDYTIRLTAHLFAAHLLDREHYFDWLLAALDAASLDQLPLWLLLLQIHWDELVQTRPCGRRLTHLLLDKLHHAASRDDGDVLGPLRARMAQLLRPLVTARPENLVAPHTWAKYASTLHAHLDRADARGQRAFQDLARRNERLAPSPPSSTLVEAAESQLYRLLDAAHPTVHPDLLYDQCLALVPDPLRMLHALWDWMSSPFRHGLARVYRAVRLTRHCHQLGLDTDGAIVTFLASRRTLPCTKANVYLAVSELARSRHFSVGAYLQWLITHGVVDRFRALDPDAPCEIRLLAELPLHGLPPHLRNLRRMLLARLDFAADDEATVIARAELEFLVQLTDLPASHYDASRELSSDDALDLARVSRTVRSELSRSIRLRVAQHVVKGDPVGPANWKDLTVEAGTSAISITDLTRVRQALEQMQDFSILADVLKLVATSNNATVLASVVDTLNYHVDIFAAMGAVDDIFGDVLDRHHALKARKAADKGLLVALTEVAAQLPGRRETHLLLASEVQRHHRKSVVAAYSPVSDHTTDALQSADSDFHDELERLLSSGTSMDKPTLTRMFATVMSRVEVAWADASARNLACALLSSRLRTFDPATYDERMEHWLDALVRRDSRPDLSQSWFPLMVTGCLTAKAAVAASTRFLATPQQGPARARQTRVALETLRFVVWDSDPLQPDVAAPDRYRFRVQRRAFTTAHPLQFLAIIRQSLESLAGESDATLRGDLDRLLEQESLLGTLRMMIVHHTSQVYAELVTPVLNGPASALPWLRRLADRLFDGSSGIGSASSPPSLALAHRRVGFTDMDADLEMARVVHAVGTLSLPFCQLKLQLTLNAVPSANPSSMAADRRGLVQEFLTAIDGIGDEDNDSWFDLLTKLDDDTAGSICELAEHSLLDRAVLSNAHSPVKADAAAVHRYLLLVQMTAHGISKSSAATIVSTLADRLEIVLRYVGRVRGQRGEEMADDTASAGASRLERRAAAMTSIVILLHLIVIHKDDLVPSANRSAASSAVASGARCRILDCLRAILQRPALCDSVEIHEFVFDLTGWLLDALSSLETPTSTVTSPRLLHHKAAAATEASPPANIDGSTTSYANPQMHYLFSSPLFIHMSSDAPPLSAITTTEHSTTTITGHGTRKRPRTTTTTTKTMTMTPYALRHWEMLPEPTPHVSANDTSLSLALFAARRA